MLFNWGLRSEYRKAWERSQTIFWVWWKLTTTHWKHQWSDYIGQCQLRQENKKILERSLFAFQSPRKKIKCSSLLIDLHGGSLCYKFSFPFDQLSEGNSVNPIIIWTKCHLIVMKLLYPVNCFFVLISRNKEIKKIISVSRAGDLRSLLTVILAHSQPLYRSWNTVLLLAVFVLISIKLPIYWALPVSTGLLYPGPDGDQSCTHELLLFSQADNSFQTTNKPTILGYK